MLLIGQYGKSHNILLVLALASEGELVLRLAVRDLVDTEPLVRGTEEAREVALDILNVVELRSERVVDINDDDLPVCLLLVDESHDTEDLDLLDLASVADKLADLANVKRVVVTLGLGLGVDAVGVFPGLLRRVSDLGPQEPMPRREGHEGWALFHTWGKAP